MTDFDDDDFEVLDEAVTIDCEGVYSIYEFWRRYVEGADVASLHIFGRNFHALNDAFWGGPGMPRYRVVRFRNSQALAQFGNLLGALQNLAKELEERALHGFRLILE